MHAARHPFPNASLSPTPDVPPQVPNAFAPAASVLAGLINPILTTYLLSTPNHGAQRAQVRRQKVRFSRGIGHAASVVPAAIIAASVFMA